MIKTDKSAKLNKPPKEEIAEKLKVCKKVVLNVLNKKHYVSEIKRLSN